MRCIDFFAFQVIIDFTDGCPDSTVVNHFRFAHQLGMVRSWTIYLKFSDASAIICAVIGTVPSFKLNILDITGIHGIKLNSIYGTSRPFLKSGDIVYLFVVFTVFGYIYLIG